MQLIKALVEMLSRLPMMGTGLQNYNFISK